MAHQNNTVLPIQVVQGLMEEMRERRSNPTAPLNSVESHAHEIMSHNWNVGGQDILRLFPSVVGACLTVIDSLPLSKKQSHLCLT